MRGGEKNYHQINRGEPEESGEKNYDDPYWNDTGWDDGGYSEDSRGLIQERGDSRGSILGNTTSYNPLFLERPEKNGLYADYAEAVLEDDTRESGEKMVGSLCWSKGWSKSWSGSDNDSDNDSDNNNESLTNADIYDNMLSVTTKGALL